MTGEVAVRHRPAEAGDDPPTSNAPARAPAEPEALARLTPPPLAEDLTRINKVSQNLHAELMLRRLGLIAGTGSIEDGVAVVAAMMARAGVPRTGWDLSDGSGMSTYNRVAPRAVVALLRWAAAQPWGAAWRATFPVAGVDGTLARPLPRHCARRAAVRQDRNAQRHQRAVGLHDRAQRPHPDLLLLRQ